MGTPARQAKHLGVEYGEGEEEDEPERKDVENCRKRGAVSTTLSPGSAAAAQIGLGTTDSRRSLEKLIQRVVPLDQLEDEADEENLLQLYERATVDVGEDRERGNVDTDDDDQVVGVPQVREEVFEPETDQADDDIDRVRRNEAEEQPVCVKVLVTFEARRFEEAKTVY